MRLLFQPVRLLLLASLICLPRAAFSADAKPDQVEKMEKALPESAPAKPAQARKVLVYTRASGFVHSSIPLGAKTIEALGKKTGAFTVTKITDDPSVFDEDNLKEFDAVVLMSTTGDFLLDKSKEAAAAETTRKQNLLNFVSSGKGLVGIHAATDAYYKWPEYGQMIGGYFQNHPYSKIMIRVDDPSSPITAQFEGKEFEFTDEIYVFKPDVYSRDNLRVLLSINVEKSNLKDQARKDQDYAVAWIKKYGKGRVFYTLLGHREETYMNPLGPKFFLAGLQYALGDLKAEDAPSTGSATKSDSPK